MKQQTRTFSISVLLCHERDGWAAQCLEYDIAAQGKTLAQAKDAFQKAFIAQIVVDVANGNEPLFTVSPAPQMYWNMFKESQRLADRTPFYIPPQYMVRATAEDVRICA